MEIYLVGGAVRDELLDLPVTERDWVVVGSSPEEMLKLGYKPVGKDFPVFLHPKTHDEYALARTERKIGPGYKGFSFYAAPEVGLEEDLKRRDLTINAIAKDSNSKLIDPFNGKVDLKNKVLRHVSPAFVEDPVRILRVARFVSRFGDFSIDPETMALMKSMVEEGEINSLVSERVWQEFHRALQTAYPYLFFSVLGECGALSVLFPELADNSDGVEALKKASEQSLPVEIRWACLLYNLEKKPIQELCARYRVPRNFSELAIMMSNYYQSYQQLLNSDAESLLSLLESLDAFRRAERFTQFLLACDTIAGESHPSLKSQRLLRAYTAANAVDPTSFVLSGMKGDAIGKALQKAQLIAIKQECNAC